MKPQDIVVVLKMLDSGWPGSFSALAAEVGLSVSETHAAVRRAQQAGLLDPADRHPNKSAIAEFLICGLRYAFPASQGAPSRGMPTSYAAPPLNRAFQSTDDGDMPVWPDPNGDHRGYALKPLYRSAPEAARKDARLYEWLALADALRGGRARERSVAADIVRTRLNRET